jgi:hypothetical protein
MIGKEHICIFLKKIGHSSIFRKTIYGVLAAIALYAIGNLGFKSYEDLIKKGIDFAIYSIRSFWREITIIILIIILITMLISKIYKSQIEFRNKKWIIKVIKNDPSKYSWLLWFVVNGTLVGKLQSNYVINTGLYDSKVLMELSKRRIITIDQINCAIIISDRAYDIIEVYLKKKKDKSLLNIIKTTTFSDLVFSSVMFTQYNT